MLLVLNITILSYGVQITGKSLTNVQETGYSIHLCKWYIIYHCVNFEMKVRVD